MGEEEREGERGGGRESVLGILGCQEIAEILDDHTRR